ncbi:MAG: hypothetical protein Q6373_013905 [Candidatus Sigynarchaeota archaeon]
MAFENELVLIARFVIVVVYLYMFLFFRKNYLKSKAAGFTNKFFVGYAFFFLVLFCYQLGYSISELGSALHLFDSSWLEGDFPGYSESHRAILFFVLKMVKPIFIIGISSLMLLIAGQVYPLELTLNWNRWIITKFLIIVSIGVLFIFIPQLTWTYYSFVLCTAAVLGVVIGLVMNMGINIKLAKESTGELRVRSIAIIFASLLFYIGFIYTLSIMEISVTRPFGISEWAKWDTIFGYILQIISAILYRQGLRIRD